MKRSVGIFIPVYYRKDSVKRSIESLASTTLKADAFQIRACVYVGVNGAGKELNHFLNTVARKILEAAGFEYVVRDWGKNVGKPATVNSLVKLHRSHSTLDYIVSYDSDIVITDKMWLIKFIDAFEKWQGPKQLGALAADQTGHNCHVIKRPVSYKAGSYNIVSQEGNFGIAGAVIFTPTKVWDLVGGYKAHRIFASDDGHFVRACYKHKLIMGVLKEVSVLHPTDKNTNYTDWKFRAARDQLKPDEMQGFKFGAAEV